MSSGANVEQSFPRYAGSWPVMVTPFREDLAIDFGAYRDMVHWYLDHGVGGLYANCLSSEMYLLENDERLRLVREAVRIANGRVPVAATGNLGPDEMAHVSLCRRVAREGADIVMLVVPSFVHDEEALEAYYLRMAEKVNAPLGLYECPVPRDYHLGISLVRRLAASGRFVAYKETSCDWERIRSLQSILNNTPLCLLQANVPHILDAARVGVPGSMNVASIIVPDLVEAVIAGGQRDDGSVEKLHRLLCQIHLAQRTVHPSGSKYLLSRRGLFIGAQVRQPDARLTVEERVGLDYASAGWFDADGELTCLRDLIGEEV